MRTRDIVIKGDLEYSDVYWKYEAEICVQEDGLIRAIDIVKASGQASDGASVNLTEFHQGMIEQSVKDKVMDGLDKIDFNVTMEDE